MKRKKYKAAAPACIVVWQDAAMSTAPHWQDGTQPPKPRRKQHLCVSVGWMTHLDEHWVQLAQTLTDGAHGAVVDIPRGMVQSITVLEPVGEWEGA